MFEYASNLAAHQWVSLCLPMALIISSSRDKKCMVWELTPDGETVGYTRRSLSGHGEAVQDVTISSDGQFALSASWDKTMRLWDLSV